MDAPLTQFLRAVSTNEGFQHIRWPGRAVGPGGMSANTRLTVVLLPTLQGLPGLQGSSGLLVETGL